MDLEEAWRQRRLRPRFELPCALCGLSGRDVREKPEARTKMTLDHIIPQSMGGTHAAVNLQQTHRHCNERRGNRIIASCVRTGRTVFVIEGCVYRPVDGWWWEAGKRRKASGQTRVRGRGRKQPQPVADPVFDGRGTGD